jgi:glycosidase
VWRDPADGGVSELESIFGGSAWTLDETTGLLSSQRITDLNWRNPQVKHEMFNMLRFWLDMGVDGFRSDAINTVYEVRIAPPACQPIQWL